ncbi:MAG TPA: pyrroline-5-carboxylate reductase [Candidatus Deferrimicrobiaceae bacterium]|jgi:pyrroline-5-carboxylate reductase
MKGLGFIGAGNMGEAMIKGVIDAGLLPPEKVFAFDVRAERCADLHARFGVTAAATVEGMLAACDTVVVAVKPQVVPSALRELPSGASRGMLFISIAAGVPLATLMAELGNDSAVVRAMPNTPAMAGMAATGIFCSPRVSAVQKETAMALFGAFGVVVEMPKEELLDAVTAVSGSGPAYVFMFIEAMADAGVRAGLTREDAMKLSVATVEGSARMLRESGQHPGRLKDMVMSPGGTTAAAVVALEQGAFRGLVMTAVEAAWKRCRELSK